MCVRCRCDGAALEQLFAPAQQLLSTRGWQHTGGVQLGRFMALAMAGASGEHQIFCGRAVKLPGLGTVGSVWLGVMCPLCVSTRVLD